MPSRKSPSRRRSPPLALLLFAVIQPLASHAQAPAGSGLDSPKDFYSQGYVHAERHGTPKPDSSPASALSAPAAVPQVSSEAEQTQNGTPSPVGSVVAALEEAAGEKPQRLRLLVAGQDPGHLRQQLSDFLELAATHKIPVQDVFVVGDPLKVYQEAALHEYEAHPSQPIIRVVRKVPAPFAAARTSPALILQMGEGLTMVEGYRDVSRLFSKEGRFLEPASGKTSP